MREIKVLHLEPTDVCQAKCPLCLRELDPGFRKDLKHHLRLEQIQAHISDQVIAGLDKMFMCGVYGDPAAGYYTQDIYRYFRKINPGITLGMNTNGGLQSTFWWRSLGKIINCHKDYCVFSIDGLEDTNHIYRKNVNWNTIMNNARAFIEAGGNAHWDMLVYEHNQHQVDACEQLARDMGFRWFRAKISKRGFTDQLKAPIGWHLPPAKNEKIICHALKEESMYINAQGQLFACCWLSGRQPWLTDQHPNLVNDDIKTVSLTWNTDNPHPTCKNICSSNQVMTNFTDQWQRNIELCQPPL